METSSLSLPTPFPAVDVVVSYGGENREATLVDQCVLFLLKQKREEGMFLSSALGDLLAPQMGVKVLWTGTNQTEIVQASSIRIINNLNYQQQQQNNFVMPGESIIERKRLISSLHDSSSSFGAQGLSSHLDSSFGSYASNDKFIPESLNKRRKVENDSNWLQEQQNSNSSEILPTSLATMGKVNNSNPFLNNLNFHQQPQQEQFNRSMMMTNNNSVSDENQILKRLLSAKRSTQMGNASKSTNKEEEKIAQKTDSEAAEKEWQFMYQRLIMYMKERGLEKVPTRITMDPDLRNWVAQQRLYFKKRTLSSNRQQLLQSVGFHQDKFTLKWDEKYERLLKFKKEHGHTNVPFHYEKDRQLGTWVSKQRVRIRNSTISPEEKARLDAIGFVPNRFNARWEEMFRRLVAYKRTFGDSNVPRVYEKDPQLAQWVLNQKDAFREGKLKPDRQIKLEAIGFSWSTFYEGDLEWERNFQKLLAHKSKHGHIRFFDEQKLARWVALQQSLHSMGTLNDQRRAFLVSAGVIPANGQQGAASTRAAILQKQELHHHQEGSMSAVPPMGLRQSFSDWRNNPTSNATSTFF